MDLVSGCRSIWWGDVGAGACGRGMYVGLW